MTIQWSCAFCNVSIEGDSVETELGVAFPPNEAHQFFRAHLNCLMSNFHPAAASEVINPIDDW